MISKKLRAILIPAFLLLLLFIASVLLANSLIQRPSVQQYLLTRVSEVIGFDLHAGKIEISLWGGIGISAHDLEAKSRLDPERITASRVRIGFDAGELLKGRIIPTRMFLFQPRIDLVTEKVWSPSRPGDVSAVKNMLLRRLTGLSAVSMKQAHISIKGLPFELEDANFSASRKSIDPIRFDVSLKGKFGYKKEKVPFILQGKISQDIKAKVDPFAEMMLNASDIPLAWIPWPAYLPVEKGHATARIKFSGTPDGPVSAEGRLIVNDLCFQLVRPRDKKAFSFSPLELNFKAVYHESVIKISSIKASTPDFTVVASSSLNLQESSNPRLTLMVETPFMELKAFKSIFPAPILPRWIENRLFPVFTDSYGSVRVNHFSLQGTLNQIRNLNRPENAGAFSLKISWKDLEILEDGSSLPFEKVSGQLRVKDGELFVSGVNAGFGRSTIKNGTLDVSTMYGETISYDISLDGLFEFEDLMRQRDMDLIPINLREYFQRFESASGGLSARISFRFERGWDYPQVQKGNFILKDCMIVQEDLVFPLVLGEAQIRVDEKMKSHFQGKGLWGNTRFNIRGSIDNISETGRADVLARADINEITDRFYRRGRFLPRFSDPVPCRITLIKEKGIWRCQGEADLREVTLDSPSFSMEPKGKADKILFNMDFHPEKKVNLKKVGFLLGNSSLELSGSFDLTDMDFIDFRIVTPGLLLEDLGVGFKKTSTRAKGILICDIQVTGSRKNPLMTAVMGDIEAQDLYFHSKRFPSPISKCHFKLKFLGKKIFINSMKMQVGRSPIRVSGELKGWAGLTGELMVNADYLDVSDFVNDANWSIYKSKEPDKTPAKEEEPEKSSFNEKSDIQLKIKAFRGQWRELGYGHLESECIFQSGNFIINRSRFEMEHGVLTLGGHVHVGQDAEKFLSMRFNLTNQPVSELLHSIGFEKAHVEGPLNLKGTLSMMGKSKEELISSLAGNADFLIKKGTIKKSHAMFKVLDAMSIEKILSLFKKKPQGVSKEGLYFKTLGGHIDIHEGIFATEDLVMKSHVFNAIAKGSVDLTNKWVDFDIGVQPLGTLDAVLSRIPGLGYVLTGKEKSILIYYFKLSGPLQKTKAKYVPLKNLGKSTMGFFKRLFLIE